MLLAFTSYPGHQESKQAFWIIYSTYASSDQQASIPLRDHSKACNFSHVLLVNYDHNIYNFQDKDAI